MQYIKHCHAIYRYNNFRNEIIEFLTYVNCITILLTCGREIRILQKSLCNQRISVTLHPQQ